MSLIEPNDGLSIYGVQLPQELYWVLTSPAPLAGMKYPRRDFPWSTLASVGFSQVVSLHPGPYNPAPLSVLFSEHLEDLVHGGPPVEPDREREAIKRAVAAVVRALHAGEGVVIHCMGGRGRTGTVLGCTLRELGCEADVVLAYLNRLHKARGREGWPEAAWQGKLVQSWNSASAKELRNA